MFRNDGKLGGKIRIFETELIVEVYPLIAARVIFLY
jgi:hypothetical protein